MTPSNVDYSDNTFSIEYFISLIIVIVVCNILVKRSPQMNTIVIIIIGLLIAYISIKIIHFLLPGISKISLNLYLYSTYQLMTGFNSTGYVHVWPPILAVLIVFVILLYTRKLG